MGLPESFFLKPAQIQPSKNREVTMIKIKIISSLEKVFVDSSIDSFTPFKKVSVLKGERLSFQIVHVYDTVNSPPIYETLRLMPTLSGELASMASLRGVAHVPVTKTIHFNGTDDNYVRTAPGLYPDILRPMYYGGKFSFTPCSTNSTWVEINIPKDMQAGDYTFKLELDGNQYGKCECELAVEVIDDVLPDEDIYFTQWFHADCLANYYDVEVWSDRHFEIVENFISTARRNGINMILTPVFTPPLDTAVGGERRTTQLVDVVRNNGEYSFGFDKLDRWIEILDRCGVEYIEISHLFTQWGAKHAPKIMATVDGEYKRIFGWETDAHSEEYVNFLRTFLVALLTHLRERGDDKRCFFHLSDEPHSGDEEHYQKSKETVADILSGYPIMDALSTIDFYKFGLIDHPIPATNRIKPFLEAKVPGLWTYYCVSQPINVSNRYHSMPNWRNRSIGMQIYKYNIAGFLQWGYNFYNNQYSGDPINPYYEQSCDFSFPGGDPFSVYPHMDGTALESPRLVVFNEALQDIKAMKLAEKYTSHETLVAVIENALGKELTFDTCAKSSEIMLRIREDVNALIKKAVAKA